MVCREAWSASSMADPGDDPMTFLSRLYGVRPALRHRVRVRRDVEIPTADGVRLLATHYYPAGQRRPPLVLLRSPYRRGNALDQLPELLPDRGYQVLYQSLRGTADSQGRFSGPVEFGLRMPDGSVPSGMHDADVSAALAEGLTTRPLRDTLADTWAWLQSEGDPTPRADAPSPDTWIAAAAEQRLLGQLSL